MKAYRIAVAGCGPTGLAAAILLHRQGHSVTLFERFDKPHAVGSGLMLQPTGLAVLRKLGLGDRVHATGAPIDRLLGRSATSGKTVLDVRYSWLGPDTPSAIGIHRAALFEMLFDTVTEEGITVIGGRQIAGSELRGSSRHLLFLEGEVSEGYDLIVDATGIRSSLAVECGKPLGYGALWATLDWPDDSDFNPAALEQRYRRASIMVGLMPTGRVGPSAKQKATFFWSLHCDQLDAWKGRGIDDWKREVLSVWPALGPVLGQISQSDQLTFAQYSQRTLPLPAEDRQIHLGDAWHSTSPQLGQGANMGLLDAYALALALESETDLNRALEQTIRLRRGHVRLYQTLSYVLTPFYQSDSHILPVIRDFLVAHLGRLWPATWIQAAMVSGLMGNPLSKLHLD